MSEQAKLDKEFLEGMRALRAEMLFLAFELDYLAAGRPRSAETEARRARTERKLEKAVGFRLDLHHLPYHPLQHRQEGIGLGEEL